MKKIHFFLILVCAFSATPLLHASTRTIKGIVLDKYDREPLTGVTVMLKGTSTGTITYIDGDFTLTYTPTGNDILVVSYIGFRTQEIVITNKSHYEIELEEEQMMLDEVIVTGFGTVRKATVIGSVRTVSSASLVSKLSTDRKDKTATTWKRSGLKDNSIRLQVGEKDYIPLEALQVAVQVDGFRVRVLMDCFFYNNKGSGLEGTFQLKLPAEATPFYFAFGETEYLDLDEDDKEISSRIPYSDYNKENFDLTYLDVSDRNDREWSRVKEARIVSKQKAARAYEGTVSANIDPALMEWGGADMFNCRVFPLSAQTLHQIVIGYDLNMTEALDFREYILSLPKTEKEIKLDMKISYSPDMQPEVSPALEPDFAEDNHLYYSVINPEEKEFIIRYDYTDAVLLIQHADYDEEVDIPYFAANYRVELPQIPQENLPEEAVFLLDVSLSSSPDKLNIWIKLLEEILDNNRDIIKRFAVYTFNIDGRWYNKTFMRNNYHNQSMLLEYLNTLSLEGATDLASALREGSNPSWMRKGKNTPKHIFLLSDADCNWGETNMHKLKQLIYPGDRVHTYKTGLSGSNTGIMNYLSKSTGGFAFTVTGEEEARLTASSFRYKPWDIERIIVKDAEDFLIAGNPIQLYNGQKLIFTGREIPEGEIRIDVSCGERTNSLVCKASEVIISSLVSRIYGQIASSYLESYGWQAEKAAVNYSTYYRVPGQYTSFLMLESSWDYEEWGIDEEDAGEYVEENPVTGLVKNLEENSSSLLLGNSKADFLHWIEQLKNEDLDPSEEFDEYLKALPENVFDIPLKSRYYNVFLEEQQTSDEKNILQDEGLRFDPLYKLARRRSSYYGKPDGLKLLSSVVECNASDIMAIRDVAMAAIDWNMPDQAYYLMRRIIDWRHGEGIAYITAADALAKAGYIEMALAYYYICMENEWDYDYGSLSTIAAFKCLRYLNQIQSDKKVKLSAEVKKYLPYFKEVAIDELEIEGFDEPDEADILVMVSWNINDTDIDLHVIEPTGEKCYYGNSKTEIGGKLSIDVTDGYGPEMYVLKKAVPGSYSVLLDYYSDSGLQTASKAKAYVEVYQNWGRKKEKLTRKTVELRSGDWEDYEEDKNKQKIVMKFKVK